MNTTMYDLEYYVNVAKAVFEQQTGEELADLKAHFGAEAMGIAAFAWRFAKQMPERIAPVVMRYLLPLLVRREIRIRHVVSRLLVLLVPVFVGLIGVSPWVVPVVFGERWRPAIPFIQVMSVSAFASALLQPVAPWLLARQVLWGVVGWNVLVSVGGIVGAWLAVRGDWLLLSSAASAGWSMLVLAGAIIAISRREAEQRQTKKTESENPSALRILLSWYAEIF